MRYLVNGREADLVSEPAVKVTTSEGRLVVEGRGSALVRRSKGKVLVSYQGRTFTVEKLGAGGPVGELSGEIHAPIPGLIIEVYAAVGDQVKQGDRLLVLEAMKMQQPMVAPFDGVVTEVGVRKGEQVTADALLAKVSREA
jgi:3-methylcrotonyl-CoA carboxylase alpha subunit